VQTFWAVGEMKKRVLITDVDNTLFDWVDIWYRSFSAMIEKVCEISGLSAEALYPSVSRIHQKHGTSEYAFLLEELPELKEIYGNEVLKNMMPAIQNFREARREALVLYDDVERTLKNIRSREIKIIAYTESKAFYSNYRFRKLGLDHLVDYLYSPPDHELPVQDVRKIRMYAEDTYTLALTQPRFTPDGEIKPNPHILESILNDIGFCADEALYIGDSLMKDIWMAQQAGVLDAWASYGRAQHSEQYELLKKVTHWTPQEVAREKKIMESGEVQPTLTVSNSFAEILDFLE
jgi:FMN phosphatase YigB (HAD superfamily)